MRTWTKILPVVLVSLVAAGVPAARADTTTVPWTVRATGAPAHAARDWANYALTGTKCWTAADCVGVGTYPGVDRYYGQKPFAFAVHGDQVSAQTLPLPAGPGH